MTEDTLRFAVIRSLQQQGVRPGLMAIEWPMVELGHGKLDLLVRDDGGHRAAIELKFPRDARGPVSPDTMTLGELLSDFHRLARLPVHERWVVQLLGDRLRGYLTRLAARHPVIWPTLVGEQLLLTGAAMAGLPATARHAVADWPVEHDVTAECTAALELPGQLALLVFAVAPLPGVTPEQLPEPVGNGEAATAAGTARDQFLAAGSRLRERNGQDTFRRQDLINEVVRGGSTLSIKTLGQMISVHLCVEPGTEGYGQHADFERVSHGLFRLRSP